MTPNYGIKIKNNTKPTRFGIFIYPTKALSTLHHLIGRQLNPNQKI
jgi:hypothetical protein